ncbi:hypothetical protein MLD52_03760 [Puniceicoccaceae bacterium K14]|nr:hypothetical protein [Puniceicoccaceae bacterium K14]
MTPKTLTMIRLKAKEGAEAQLRDALTGAGDVIRSTEPLTLQWYGVDLGEGNFAIIDTFVGQEGRDAHFSGKVAALLHDNADDLVEGGWDGVVGAIENAEILSSNLG